MTLSQKQDTFIWLASQASRACRNLVWKQIESIEVTRRHIRIGTIHSQKQHSQKGSYGVQAVKRVLFQSLTRNAVDDCADHDQQVHAALQTQEAFIKQRPRKNSLGQITYLELLSVTQDSQEVEERENAVDLTHLTPQRESFGQQICSEAAEHSGRMPAQPGENSFAMSVPGRLHVLLSALLCWLART